VGHAGDGAAADPAGLPGPAVHQELQLEEAGFPPAVQVIGHRGAALGDGRLEDAPGFMQHPGPVLEGEPGHGGGGMEPGGKEDLAGVNVADAGQDAAVHEKVFQRPGARPGLLGQPRRGHPPGERLPAHHLQGGDGRARRED